MNDKSYLISIKLKPVGMNYYNGKPWYHGLKKRWTQKVVEALQQANVPTHCRKIHLIIRYFFPTQAHHDADNYSPKLLLDGFTKAQIVQDDDPFYLTWELAYRSQDKLGFLAPYELVEKKNKQTKEKQSKLQRVPRVDIEIHIME